MRAHFNVMHPKPSSDPGFFVVSAWRVADEAELLSVCMKMRHEQVLVPTNEEALTMLLRLSVRSLR